MTREERVEFWFGVVIGIVVALLAVALFAGCAAPQSAGLAELPEQAKLPAFEYKEKLKLIYETNWLATVFICGGAGSIFMIIQGVKAGWGVLAASAGGLLFMRIDQALAEKLWLYLVAGGIILFGFIWYTINTFIRRRAFSEVVAGGERLKEFFPVAKVAFKKSYAGKKDGGVQSKSTKKLVKKEREKLNSN